MVFSKCMMMKEKKSKHTQKHTHTHTHLHASASKDYGAMMGTKAELPAPGTATHRWVLPADKKHHPTGLTAPSSPCLQSLCIHQSPNLVVRHTSNHTLSHPTNTYIHPSLLSFFPHIHLPIQSSVHSSLPNSQDGFYFTFSTQCSSGLSFISDRVGLH